MSGDCGGGFWKAWVCIVENCRQAPFFPEARDESRRDAGRSFAGGKD